MNRIQTFQKLVQTYCTEGLVDSLCIELGYDYETDYRDEYPDVSPEDFVRENRTLPEDYRMDDIDNIRSEVEENILALKDNEVALDHYIRDILSPIRDNLGYFYSPRPFGACTAFQKLVPFLTTYNTYEKIPDKMAAIHRAYIEEMVKFGFLELSTEEQEQKIQALCANTWECFQKRQDIPSYLECRYFRWLFQNVAAMIESALLEAGCKNDLFWYQNKYDIILFPSLTTSDLWANSAFSRNVAETVSRGYDTLDRFTEMAGYAVYDGKEKVGSLISCGIPEIDALLKQTNTRMPADYPSHHFRRNLRSFSAKCQEMAESDESLDKKRFRIRKMVHILGHCYETFNSVPQLRDYVDYVIPLFSALEVSFLRSPNPICVKDMCQDLHYESMLTDAFPDTAITKVIFLTQKLSPDTQWEPYYLSKSLGNAQDYYEKQVCENCVRKACPFRKATHINETKQQSPVVPLPVNNNERFNHSLIAVCTQIEPLLPNKITRLMGKNKWAMKKDANLFAYIGFALCHHLNIKRIPWASMSQVISCKAKEKYLSVCATEFRKMLKGDLKKNFPAGYHIVDDALDKLPREK